MPLQTPLCCLLCAKAKGSQSWVSASCLASGGEQLLRRWPASTGLAPSRSLRGHWEPAVGRAGRCASHRLLTSYRLSTVPAVGCHQGSWESHWRHVPGRTLGSKLLFVIIKGKISNLKPLGCFTKSPKVKLPS